MSVRKVSDEGQIAVFLKLAWPSWGSGRFAKAHSSSLRLVAYLDLAGGGASSLANASNWALIASAEGKPPWTHKA